jgi:hypothetical protein
MLLLNHHHSSYCIYERRSGGVYQTNKLTPIALLLLPCSGCFFLFLLLSFFGQNKMALLERFPLN